MPGSFFCGGALHGRPATARVYAALDDEQKARLLRDLTLSKSQAREGDRAAERLERRSRQRGISDAVHDGEANAWTNICEPLTEALRGWPICEIERRVGLSPPQRVHYTNSLPRLSKSPTRWPVPAPPRPRSAKTAFLLASHQLRVCAPGLELGTR